MKLIDPNTLNSLLFHLGAEIADAIKKHPENYTSPHEGHSIIREELEELWEHVRRNTGCGTKARTEALQVAVTAVRYALSLCPPFDDVVLPDQMTRTNHALAEGLATTTKAFDHYRLRIETALNEAGAPFYEGEDPVTRVPLMTPDRITALARELNLRLHERTQGFLSKMRPEPATPPLPEPEPDKIAEFSDWWSETGDEHTSHKTALAAWNAAWDAARAK